MIFQGLKIALDIPATKEKQHIIKLIKENGGETAPLNNKTDMLVITPPKNGKTNSKIDQALKLKVQVVNSFYIIDCAKLNQRQSTNNYIFVPQQEKKLTISSAYVEDRKLDVKPIIYPINDTGTPFFPEDQFEIINSAILQKSDLFSVVELHIGGQAAGQVKDTDTQKYNKTYFRIFVHKGNMHEMQKSIKECMFLDTLESAEHWFATTIGSYVEQSYVKVQLASSNIGSEKARRAVPAENITSSPQVTNLVKTVYEEATKKINGMLMAPGGVTIAPEGQITSPLGQILLHQVEKAESILLQICELLKQSVPDNLLLYSLTSEFYSLIPRQSKTITTSNVQEIHDDIQLMKDILSVGEGLGAQQGLSEQEIRYRAMQCEISYVEKSTAEFSSLLQFVNKSMQDQNKFTIRNIYKISRKIEQSPSNISNQRTLFHGTRASNLLGILSRGILLPNIALTERTDLGMLGAGVYFAQDASVSAKYCSPNASGSKFLLVCNVALGTTKKFTIKQPSLTAPPQGYNSVQGVKRTVKQHTQFWDDEFAVYNTNQFYFTHLIEFEDEYKFSITDKEYVNENTSLKVIPKQYAELKEEIPESMPYYGTDESPIPSGLLDPSGTQMPLLAVHVSAKLLDMVGEVTILQHYRNEAEKVIEETKYIFPLDEMAAVCGFEAFVNGKHLIGSVKEKTQAHKEYKEAIAQGHGAYLIDEEKPDAFSVSIGNLPPKADVIIKICYVTELTISGDDICFQIPSSVSPEQRGPTSVAVRDSLRQEEAGGEKSLFGFSLQVAIEMPSDILSLKSRHKIYTKLTESKATVTLPTKLPYLESNFSLFVGVKDVHAPRMWVEIDDKGNHASMLSFFPQFEAQTGTSQNEILFLVDRSCSMKGETMQDVTRTLRALMTELRNSHIMVNLVDFGSTSNWLFDASTRLDTEKNRKIVWQHINSMKANFGSTELFTALQQVYVRARAAKVLSNIFLLTDGQVSNSDNLLRLIAQNSSFARLFVFGMGSNPARYLIRAMARIGNGSAEFITPNKKSNHSKLRRYIERAKQPSFSSIEVNFASDSSIVQAPAKINAIFNKERQVVYAFAGPCTHATLSAIAPGGGKIVSSVYTHESSFLRGSLIHRLAARSIIRDYQDGEVAASQHMDDFLKRTQKKWIIDLSIEHSILSQYTSFVIIEPRDDKKTAKTPELSDLISQQKVDELQDIEWAEIVERNRIKELDIAREQVLVRAKAAKEHNRVKDCISLMYQYCKDPPTEKRGANIQDVEILWNCLEKDLKQSVDDLHKELQAHGNKESPKSRRLRQAVQAMASTFLSEQAKFPQYYNSSAVLLNIAKIHCHQYLASIGSHKTEEKMVDQLLWSVRNDMRYCGSEPILKKAIETLPGYKTKEEEEHEKIMRRVPDKSETDAILSRIQRLTNQAISDTSVRPIVSASITQLEEAVNALFYDSAEKQRITKRLEAENDDLNIKLDCEIKSRQKTEKYRKKIEHEFRATKTLLDEESATKTQTESISTYNEPPPPALHKLFWGPQSDSAPSPTTPEVKKVSFIENSKITQDPNQDDDMMYDEDYDEIEYQADDGYEDEDEACEIESMSYTKSKELEAALDQDKIKRLEKQLLNVNQEREELHARLRTMQTEGEREKKAKEELQSNLSSLLGLGEARQRANPPISQKELDYKQAEIDQLKQSLQQEIDMRNKDAEIKKVLRAELTNQENLIDEYERQKLNFERTKKKLEAETEELQATLESEQFQRKRLEKTAKVASAESASVPSQSEFVQELRVQLADAQKRERSLRNEYDEIRDQLESEIASKDKLSKQKRSFEVEMEELKDQLDELEENLEEEREANRKKDKEIHELKEKLAIEQEITQELYTKLSDSTPETPKSEESSKLKATIKLIQKNPLLRNLASSAQARVAASMKCHRIKTGETISTSSLFYLIESGNVEIRTDTPKRGVETCVLGPSQSFGEPQEWIKIEAAVAKSACVVWAIDHLQLDSLLGDDLSLFLEYYEMLLHISDLQLTAYELWLLCYMCSKKTYSKNEQIVKVGQNVDSFYILGDGEVAKSTKGVALEAIYSSKHEGIRCFGADWIKENKAADANIYAKSVSVVILEIPKSSFVSFVLPRLK